MRHEEDGLALLAQLPYVPHDGSAVVPVQVARWLVGKYDSGAVCQRPGNGNPLLFSGAQLAWESVRHICESNAFQQLPREFFLPAGVLPREVERKLNVLSSREVGKEVERLEDKSEVFPSETHAVARGYVVERHAIDNDLPLGGCQQPCHHVQECCFSAAARTEDRDEVAVFYLQVEASNGLHGPVGFVYGP